MASKESKEPKKSKKPKKMKEPKEPKKLKDKEEKLKLKKAEKAAKRRRADEDNPEKARCAHSDEGARPAEEQNKPPKKTKIVKKHSDGAEYAVKVRLEPALGQKAEAILERCGFSVQNAVRAFLERVVATGEMPFDVPKPQSPAEPEPGVWCEQTEEVFQQALDEIDEKYGNALRNLAN